MNQEYYDTVTKLEQMGCDPEYILGWEGGYLGNPHREEQRQTDAYRDGYEDGQAKGTDNASKWSK
ncbi:MAG: hypothetical protein AMJ69_01130 [Gammaproteobacteria bacterium SG8_47]|nr:MAG: hypothetical protein AMJ69_01130 [Gammaproteobacteria bacterium SG8_47]